MIARLLKITAELNDSCLLKIAPKLNDCSWSTEDEHPKKYTEDSSRIKWLLSTHDSTRNLLKIEAELNDCYTEYNTEPN